MNTTTQRYSMAVCSQHEALWGPQMSTLNSIDILDTPVQVRTGYITGQRVPLQLQQQTLRGVGYL